MKQKQTPARSKDIILHQRLKLIPPGMVNKIAPKTCTPTKARSFSVMSHLTAMIFAQLTVIEPEAGDE